jgi:CheY-like chemotaxis protein
VAPGYFRRDFYVSGTSSTGNALKFTAQGEVGLHVTGRSGPPRRILLAGNNPLNEKVAIGTLREARHHITVARNGLEAAEKVTADHFDVVLMDGQMPEMDGFSATTAIREREGRQGRRVPIIALTANAMKGERQRCLEAGMNDYASKSIRREQILARSKN